MTTITEADVEAAALDWLSALGWQVAHGPDIAPDTPNAERADYGQVMLERRLRDALAELNPGLPANALDDAFRKLIRPDGSTLEARNRAFHRMLVNGVEVEYREAEGRVRGDQVRVIDFDDPTNNDWLAVNQLTVTENRNTRRADIVLFVNGLPLGIIELKNPTDEDATIWTAYQQLQTYKADLPSLFSMNEALMVSDGTEARIGTLTSGNECFDRVEPGNHLLDLGADGVLCPRCRSQGMGRKIQVSESAMRVLRHLQRTAKWSKLAPLRNTQIRSEIEFIQTRYIRSVIECDLRSAEFVRLAAEVGSQATGNM